MEFDWQPPRLKQKYFHCALKQLKWNVQAVAAPYLPPPSPRYQRVRPSGRPPELRSSHSPVTEDNPTLVARSYGCSRLQIAAVIGRLHLLGDALPFRLRGGRAGSGSSSLRGQKGR